MIQSNFAAPIIENTLGYVDCELRHALHTGGHTVFVGEVVALSATDESDPLLYFRGVKGWQLRPRGADAQRHEENSYGDRCEQRLEG